jgi:hypothetical protein
MKVVAPINFKHNAVPYFVSNIDVMHTSAQNCA